MAVRLTSRSKVKAPKPAKEKKAKKKAAARVSPQVLSDAIGGNVPDSAIRSHLTMASSLKADIEKATGAYRAHIKACKAIGIWPEDVSWFLSTKKREPEDIDAETKRRNRIAQLMKLRIGTQLGLFESGSKKQTVATAIENDEGVAERGVAAATETKKRSTQESMEKAMDAGSIAGKEGHERDGNPFTDGSPEFIKWDYGWQEGNKARMTADAS